MQSFAQNLKLRSFWKNSWSKNQSKKLFDRDQNLVWNSLQSSLHSYTTIFRKDFIYEKLMKYLQIDQRGLDLKFLSKNSNLQLKLFQIQFCWLIPWKNRVISMLKCIQALPTCRTSHKMRCRGSGQNQLHFKVSSVHCNSALHSWPAL